MRLGLARGIGAVVAADAISRDIDVIEVRRQPADCRMAILAVVTAVDMIRALAGRDDAVVAGSAGSKDLRVVDGIDRYPDIRCVAVFADVAGLYMGLRLARRVGTVVAAEAISRDVDVIEIRRQPACCRMAVVAVVAAGNVCRVFAGRGEAIVA